MQLSFILNDFNGYFLRSVFLLNAISMCIFMCYSFEAININTITMDCHHFFSTNISQKLSEHFFKACCFNSAMCSWCWKLAVTAGVFQH